MNDLKQIIGKNIIELRRQAGLTQAEFAEKINYSDKAVSKWECGSALPDISVLKEIADIFGVSLDYLVAPEHDDLSSPADIKRSKRNKTIITLLSVALCWLIATLLFSMPDFLGIYFQNRWLLFIYAVPLSAVVLLVFNSIWGKRKFNFIIISALLWSFLCSIYLSFPQNNLYLLFIIGIPAQVIIILWSGIKKRKRNNSN